MILFTTCFNLPATTREKCNLQIPSSILLPLCHFWWLLLSNSFFFDFVTIDPCLEIDVSQCLKNHTKSSWSEDMIPKNFYFTCFCSGQTQWMEELRTFLALEFGNNEWTENGCFRKEPKKVKLGKKGCVHIRPMMNSLEC